jgi:predicted Zn-ribbon and HTH transcriptional regulator
MAKNKINYTDKDRVIVSILKESENDLTLAQISERAGMPIAPGTITAAINKGLVAKTGEVEVAKPGKRQVATYVLVDKEARVNEKGKPVNYTDGEKRIMEVLGTAEAPMTLAEIAVALGVEKLTSGAINGLVKKGNVAKAGEREVVVMGKTKVSTYEFVADIPELNTNVIDGENEPALGE